MRLNKYIARAGVTSRRKADDLIIAGQVFINGNKITELGTKVDEGDEVEVNGKIISANVDKVIIAMYKPRGVTSTLEDRHAEKTIAEMLPQELPRLNPVGRLDKDSEGLIIMTNDGDLHYKLTHPSFEHEKAYEAELKQPLTKTALEELSNGINLKEGNTGQNKVDQTGEKSFKIVLHQGWNRQIRRMAGAVGNHVTMLKRTRIGKLRLEDLQPGEYRKITKEDII